MPHFPHTMRLHALLLSGDTGIVIIKKTASILLTSERSVVMKLVLSTSNIVRAGPSIRRSASAKSNAELVSSLRANFQAHAAPETATNGHANDDAERPSTKPSFAFWTRLNPDKTELEIPALNLNPPGLEEEREQYDITLKLFYLPGASISNREVQTHEAVNLVLRELHVLNIDLLIVSFPGIYFDESEDCPDKISTRGPIESEPEPIESLLSTWQTLEALHKEGLVKKLGVAELGHDRLSSLLQNTRIKPSVNQINLRDCCSVPKDLMTLAKSSSMELLVHNDCSNILPRGTLRELLGPAPEGAGILAAPTETERKRKSLHGEEGMNGSSEAAVIVGEVQPQWVVKYTAVVKNRGVVESKGYFAVAEVS